MKKRILALLTALVMLVLLLPLSFAAADGSYWDAASRSFFYNEPRYGIVICRQMNVRNKASTGGSSYGQIKNGQPVKILGFAEDDRFYVLDLESCGFKNVAPGSYGYAKSSLIKIDPEFFYAAGTIDLYATPWGDGLKNGEQGKRFFLILSEGNGWYAVQTSESSPGTSFVKASAVSAAYLSRYVVTWDAPLYDESTGAQIQVAKRFTTGRLINMTGERALLIFNEGTANELRAWISLQYIAPCLN